MQSEVHDLDILHKYNRHTSDPGYHWNKHCGRGNQVQTVICPAILIWGWRKRNLIYEDIKARSLEVLISRVRECNGETRAHHVGLPCRIFAPARPFLLRRKKAVWQRGRGAIPSQIPPRICAPKGRTTARCVQAQSRFFRF